ncbi:MAG: cyclic nucleotide-binding domain-containing protein [Verrucomicrobia bacterium]|nr:cyclic nucleotide-binding domain-containing protein [Verrucomicrobiota bacterium]MBV9657523.1 cyclic nucleotide-binding domain-containing protein [Verrucomicrobiota bacterium]
MTVYSSGDESDALYIITRGVVEIVHQNQRHNGNTPISYLGRGDMFGEMGVLSGTTRKNAIRTCEPTSVQCFKKKDFPELITRVPSFFYHVSQQVASQLLRVSDLAFVQSHCLELSGNLSNFDLVTIYQTILNSSQTGELAIANEAGDIVATFLFEAGQVQRARFYHLTGEEACWQLFLHEKLTGTFSFAITSGSDANRQDCGPLIRRNPTDLLISGLQYRDEFKLMMEYLPEPNLALQRMKLNLDWSDPEHESLRHLAETIWQLCYSTTYAVEEVFHRVDCCELKFYKAVLQLLRTGHFALLLPEAAAGNSNPTTAPVPQRLPAALRASPAVVR